MSKFPFGAMTFSELRSIYGHKPAPIIQDLLHENSLWALCAEKETGKTTLLCDLAARIMGGVTADGLVVPRPGCVIFILPEAQEVATGAIEGAMAKYGLPAHIVDERSYWIDSALTPWASPLHHEYESRITALIEDLKDRSRLDVLLIVQDTAQDGLGDDDSVSTDDTARKYYRPGRRLKARHKLCYAVIMHPGRGGDYLGSQAWFNMTDFFAFLQRESDGGRWIGRTRRREMANRHRLHGWGQRGDIGIGFRGHEVDGRIQLIDFERRRKKSRNSAEQKQDAAEGAAPAVGSNAEKVHNSALESRLTRIEKANLLEIGGITPSSNPSQQRSRIVSGLTECGRWKDEGDFLTLTPPTTTPL